MRTARKQVPLRMVKKKKLPCRTCHRVRAAAGLVLPPSRAAIDIDIAGIAGVGAVCHERELLLPVLGAFAIVAGRRMPRAGDGSRSSRRAPVRGYGFLDLPPRPPPPLLVLVLVLTATRVHLRRAFGGA